LEDPRGGLGRDGVLGMTPDVDLGRGGALIPRSQGTYLGSFEGFKRVLGA
jgi:hypothetical protein